ncbi:helix-turn-helix transcriptional regulator [Paenibacillus sp. M1]|uniref:Helix-turn-helix transcriptional regulator n=1 Tax=Paenibacillus haidiansis TaxID=1574488 RepID=A0ABU7VSK4_9BACL
MNSTSILAELDLYIKRHELGVRQFAEKLGLNAGTISHILNGTRKLTIDQLDRITEILGFSKGYFYTNYIHEYLVESTPNWRRIRPFLFKCAELEKLDCIREIVSFLLDNLMYSPLLFEAAEELFHAGKHEAAEILYLNVAESERKQHSERLALCQYRLFTIRIGKDQIQNFKTACQFEPYVERLDEIQQLDALKDLCNIYRSLRQWDRMEILAREMERKAKIHYFAVPRSERKIQELQKKLSRPLFVYIAYPNLLYAAAFEGRGDYEQSLQFTYEYADLSWVKETDERTLHWLKLFKDWSQANIYTNKLLSGDLDVLEDYVLYVKDRPDEILTALSNIVYTADRYHIDVDHIIRQFEAQIESYEHPQTNDFYKGQVIPSGFSEFLHKLALYYLRKGDYTNGFKYMRNGMDYYVNINKLLLANMAMLNQYNSVLEPSFLEALPER